jgi:malate dehydrogenase
MAGVLDSARFRYFLSEELGVSVKDVHAMTLGGHGDDMVPLVRYATVGGVPLPELVKSGWTHASEARRRLSNVRVRAAARSSPSRRRAPRSTHRQRQRLRWRNPISRIKKRVLPCAAYLTGQYGIKDMYVGVPVLIGDNGVERIVEVSFRCGRKTCSRNRLHRCRGWLTPARRSIRHRTD